MGPHPLCIPWGVEKWPREGGVRCSGHACHGRFMGAGGACRPEALAADAPSPGTAGCPREPRLAERPSRPPSRSGAPGTGGPVADLPRSVNGRVFLPRGWPRAAAHVRASARPTQPCPAAAWATASLTLLLRSDSDGVGQRQRPTHSSDTFLKPEPLKHRQTFGFLGTYILLPFE